MRPAALVALAFLLLADAPARANPSPPPLVPPVRDWWPAAVALVFVLMAVQFVRIWRRSSGRFPNDPEGKR